MAQTYYYNGSPILAPFQIRSNEPVFSADTASLKHFRTGQGVQRWEMSFEIETSDNSVDMLLGQIDAADAVQTMIMPQMREALANFTHTSSGNRTIAVNGAHTTTDTTIAYNMGGSSGAMSGVVSKGSFIKFSNSDKVYLVKQNATTGGSGTLHIHPPLQKALTGSETVAVGDNCTFAYFTQPDNITGITFSDGFISSPGTITLLEAV